MLPKTMTFPDSSKALENSSPSSLFPHTSSHIRISSPYAIVLAGIFLNLSLTFSNWTNLNTLFTSFTLTPNLSSSSTGCSGGLSPSRWRRLSPAMFSDFSFSRSLSPTGRVRKEGRLEGKELLLMNLRWRKRRKKPVATESGDWDWALAAFGGLGE